MAAVFIIVCMFTANAQTEKGKWLVYGSSNLALEMGKDKIKSGSNSNVSEKFTDFYLNAKAGMFVIDNFAAGLALNFYTGSWKNMKYDEKYTHSNVSVGPFARYYITEVNGLLPYVQADVGITKEKDEESPWFNLGVSGGFSYLLNERVALDVSLDLRNSLSSYENKEPNYNYEYRLKSSEKTKYNSSIIGINVGIVVFLGD